MTATSAWIIAADDAGESLVWEASASGLQSVASPLPKMQKFSAVRARDGTIYVVLKRPPNLDSELFAGTPARGFLPLPRTPAPSWNESIELSAAHDPADPAAFYALADSTTLHRYDAAADRWMHLADLGCALTPVFTALGPDEVLCSGPNGTMLRWGDGGPATEPLPNPGESLAALTHFPGVATFAGTLESSIFERSSAGSWRGIYTLDAFALYQVHSFGLDRDRTLYIGGNFGTIGQYHPDSGLCTLDDIVSLGALLTVEQLLVLGGVIFFVADEEIAENVHVYPVGAIR